MLVDGMMGGGGGGGCRLITTTVCQGLSLGLLRCLHLPQQIDRAALQVITARKPARLRNYYIQHIYMPGAVWSVLRQWSGVLNLVSTTAYQLTVCLLAVLESADWGSNTPHLTLGWVRPYLVLKIALHINCYCHHQIKSIKASHDAQISAGLFTTMYISLTQILLRTEHCSQANYQAWYECHVLHQRNKSIIIN